MQDESALTPPSTCRICGYPFDRARGMTAFAPQPGDISICLNCGVLSLFADDLTPRPLTNQERAKVPNKALLAIGFIRQRGRFWPKEPPAGGAKGSMR
jgi:hypothetical protein